MQVNDEHYDATLNCFNVSITVCQMLESQSPPRSKFDIAKSTYYYVTSLLYMTTTSRNRERKEKKQEKEMVFPHVFEGNDIYDVFSYKAFTRLLYL